MARRGLSIVVILVAALALFLWYRDYRSKRVPNILLISIDTLRADHLGCYGYVRKITPNLDRLSAEGVLFENAFCVMPSTLPSHASILFGTWPRIHGCTNNHMKIANHTLSYLPRVMKEAGYSTAAFVSAFHVGEELEEFGGFDQFDWPKLDRTSDITLDHARGWLKQNGDKKFFLWVHLWDPHAPYDLHPEFMKNINPSFKDDFEKRYTFLGDFKYTPDQLKKMIDLYDNEIAFTDYWLGKFLDEFQSIYKNTIILIVADHGETLDELVEKERYGFDHGEFLLDHQIHVPMIVILPDHENGGLRVSNTTSLIDVFPTIMDFSRLKTPGSCQGNSLKPYLLGEPANHPDSLVFLQRRTFKRSPPRPYLAWSQYGIRERGYKLLLDVPENQSVFFRNSDQPAGGDSKVAKMRDLMERRLKQWLDATSEFENQPSQPVSPEASEKLRSFGYLQ